MTRIFLLTDEYVPHSYSRSGSFDSGSPWVRSRASSVESLRKQKSFDFTDDESDIFINREKKGTTLCFIATQNVSKSIWLPVIWKISILHKIWIQVIVCKILWLFLFDSNLILI